jgi:hypothetical protein
MHTCPLPAEIVRILTFVDAITFIDAARFRFSAPTVAACLQAR